MRKRHFIQCVLTPVLIAALGLTIGCGKSEAPDDPSAQSIASGEPAVDLDREDMVALPGAEVDLELLEDFPYFLRQESSESAEAIYAYYDRFFSDKGWSVDVNADEVIGTVIHSYQLGDELAFVTVREIGPGRNEVVLSRRNVHEAGELDDEDEEDDDD